MSTDDLQQEQQEAVNGSPLRRRLLLEISGTSVQPEAKPPQPAAKMRDLNQARLARRVDSLFHRRWLTGFGGRKKTQAQPAPDPATPCRSAQRH